MPPNVSEYFKKKTPFCCGAFGILILSHGYIEKTTFPTMDEAFEEMICWKIILSLLESDVFEVLKFILSWAVVPPPRCLPHMEHAAIGEGFIGVLERGVLTKSYETNFRP